MIFSPCDIDGVYLIDLEPRADDRGFFSRVFCAREFEEHGLNSRVVQVNNSLSRYRGTLRGMHYQLAPRAEVKIVRCIRGAIYDVAIDLRPESSTFGKYVGVELDESRRRMLYVPEGFAHGFVSLVEDTEIIYFVTEFYSPEYERGVRWNDPRFGIEWPMAPQVISDKDGQHPDFDPAYHLQ